MDTNWTINSGKLPGELLQFLPLILVGAFHQGAQVLPCEVGVAHRHPEIRMPVGSEKPIKVRERLAERPRENWLKKGRRFFFIFF